MTAPENIATLLRKGGMFYGREDLLLLSLFFSQGDGIGYVNKDVTELTPQLYSDTERSRKTDKRIITTRKGFWEIYERIAYSRPSFLEEKSRDGFCAIYIKDEQPRTLFTGNSKNLDPLLINDTISELSQRILEQRKWFAWPPRNLTGVSKGLGNVTNGFLYGLLKSFYFTIGSFCTSTLANITGQITDNDVLINIGLFIDKFADDPIKFFKFYGLVGIPLLVLSSYVGKELGKIADITRVKDLPKEALSFKYGNEAEESIREEYASRQEELRKIELYRKLKEDIDVSKYHFLEIDRVMQDRKVGGYRRDQLKDILARNYLIKSEMQPLEEIVGRVESVFLAKQ